MALSIKPEQREAEEDLEGKCQGRKTSISPGPLWSLWPLWSGGVL